ncbi:hypothetical protein HDU87_007277 [Geranomyces variabilis]|uniref:F-box domain-containing protein n=1 Tax=Geranomyces variabilis TaxID=109894 RepID=A0AAD5TEJ1_9FUNG|nr:hypothetical protein HDU87_007277 [Geranomyces variabilis]
MERACALLPTRPREALTRSSSNSNDDGSENNNAHAEPFQEVLDSLVSHALAYSSSKASASPVVTARKQAFKDELRRLLDNDYMSLPSKIDGVTELTQLYLGQNWEEEWDTHGAYSAAGEPARDGESRKRARTESLPEVAGTVAQPHTTGLHTAVMSGPTAATSSPGFLQACPEDMLLYIFTHLDAQSLAHASQTCRYWNALIVSVEKSIWARLAGRTWGMREPSCLGYTWKQYFMMHWNVQVGRHTTHRLRDIDLGNAHATVWGAPAPLGTQYVVQPAEAAPAEGLPVAVSAQQQSEAPKTRRSYVAAWPADPNHAYIVALDAETAKLAWVEADLDPLVISVAKLDDKGAQGSPEYLEGHENAIGLILSNDEGTLVSFDDSSTIIVWNLRTMEFERSINANDELGFIFSMNIHKRRIVTGGQNGRVIVWDADTGDTIWSVQVEEKYLTGLSVQNLLNVAVWEDLVAYGIWDGGFWVGSISEKREIARFDVKQMKDATARKKKGTRRDKGGLMRSDQSSASPALLPPSAGTSMTPDSEGSSWPSAVPLGSSHVLAHTHAQLQHVYDTLMAVYPPGAEPSSSNPNAGGTSENDDDDTAPPQPQPQQQLQPPQPQQPLPLNTTPGSLFPLPQPTLFPMTLALNGHVLLTNGPKRHELAVWDLRNPQGLYTLTSARSSERAGGAEGKTAQAIAATLRSQPPATTATMTAASAASARRSRRRNRRARRRLFRPPGPDIKFAEISRDGSMIYASIGPMPGDSDEHDEAEDDDDAFDTADDEIDPDDDEEDDDADGNEESRANQLLVWDYRNREHVARTRRFEKMRAGGQVDANEDNDWLEPEIIDVWVCWDEVPA